MEFINKDSVKEASSILLNVILISAFICIFYFTVAAWQEGVIAKDQVQDIIDDLTYDIEALPLSVRQTMLSGVNKIQLPDMSLQDAAVEAKNKKLLYTVIALVITILPITYAIIYFLSKQYEFSMSQLIYDNLWICLGVIITEVLFLFFVATNYKAADPNFVKARILTNIKENF